jgi:hypothetical protein
MLWSIIPGEPVGQATNGKFAMLGPRLGLFGGQTDAAISAAVPQMRNSRNCAGAGRMEFFFST